VGQCSAGMSTNMLDFLAYVYLRGGGGDQEGRGTGGKQGKAKDAHGSCEGRSLLSAIVKSNIDGTLGRAKSVQIHDPHNIFIETDVHIAAHPTSPLLHQRDRFARVVRLNMTKYGKSGPTVPSRLGRCGTGSRNWPETPSHIDLPRTTYC
jgi:hypothetical protein